MKNNILKQKLINKEVTIGSWITIGHPAIIEILATAGFEWLTIDIEHNSIDPLMVQMLISTIQSKDIAALVRVPKNDEVIIKHVLDAGADGVIIPMVNNKEDAVKAVEYVMYPPIGKRGVGLSRAQNYGVGFDEYKKWLKINVVIIAQIEHIDAINNLDEIISVEGIDGIIIGPYDLSSSMGYPGEYERPEVKAAILKAQDICNNKQIALGYHIVQPDVIQLVEKINLGYTFLAFSTDFLFMGENARNAMKKITQNKISK